MTAKEFLMLAWKIDDRIDERIEERERLLAKLTAGRGTNLTGMPRGGRYDWTDAVSRVIEADRAIAAEITKLCEVKRLVNDAIEAVADGRRRRVLELRYRNYMRWEQIADALGYDVRWVYRLHGEALQDVVVPEELRH